MADYIIKINRDFNTGEESSIYYWACSQDVISFLTNIFNDSIFNEILKAETRSSYTGIIWLNDKPDLARPIVKYLEDKVETYLNLNKCYDIKIEEPQR